MSAPSRRATWPVVKRQIEPPRANAGRGRANTAANLIYQELRDEIVSMRRKPGDAIAEKEIAQARGVSRTPVREALLRLADESLIEIFPQSGTFVARIPVDVLPEAILGRKALEETTARLAATRAEAGQTARLRKLIDMERRIEARLDRNRFQAADESCAAAIAEAL